MTTPPKKPFNLHGTPQQDQVRDKDNVALTPKAPSWARQPAPNLAPPGTSGIKRGLTSPRVMQEKPRTRFSLDEKNSLGREFKPIARPPREKGHDHER